MKRNRHFFTVLLILSLVAQFIVAPAVTSPVQADAPGIADFEGGAPAGFFVYNGASTVTTSTQVVPAGDALARPGQVGENTVLTAAFNISDYGGFGVDYAPTGAQDWSTFAGFSLWFFGGNSGLTYQIDIQDNRSNPAIDTAERFSYQFVDDAAGWRLLRIPFGNFTRRVDWQPGGAPDDGLTLTEMWGWAVVLPNTGGATQTISIDDVGVMNTIVDDFESGLPQGTDNNGVTVGFLTFQGANSPIEITTAQTPPAPVLMAVGVPNAVMQVDVNSTSYAGFIHAFENPEVNTWVPQDWSAYEGFGFWFYGNNSGSTLFIDILENRAPGSTRDDAERWTLTFLDDFGGWQYFQFPFSSLARKEVGNGAPNDGLALTEVHGWAFGTLGTGGPRTYYMDEFSLYGAAPFRPLEVTFSASVFDVQEGGSGAVTVKLNRPMGEEDPAEVSVEYTLEPGSAVPDRNYVPVPGGTLTFTNGGDSEQVISIPTIHDFKRRGDLTVVLRLSNPSEGVALGAGIEAALAIKDLEPVDADLLDDFEGFPYLWDTAGFGMTMDSLEVPAGDPLALPGQQAPYERVLEVTTPVDVQIVIRPGEISAGQIGCPKGEGLIPVAVLSTESFDATTIDANTVRFGAASEAHVDKKTGQAVRHVEDVNGDGLPDLVFHFMFSHTGYECNATDVQLTGETYSGQPIAAGGQGAFYRDFAMPRDWSSADGLSFWWYGNGSGDTFQVTLKDNRAPDPGPAGWVPVLSEEFDAPAGTLPDGSIWTPEIGDGIINTIPGWGNSELQYYTFDPANVSTDGAGNLVITTREADGSLVCYYGPCEYTSARLKTADKFEFGYGRAEARIRVPEGQGLWPAFWSLGNDIGTVGWPQSGEIDFMEIVGREPQRLFGTIHGPGYSGGGSIGGSYTLPDGQVYHTDYHVFAIEWQPGVIRWYVDGILFFTVTPNDLGSNQWVFDHPFFLMLNTAIGGNFGGPVGEDVVFPQSMRVDYVRVYQAPDTAERFEAAFVDDFTGWRRVSIPFSAFTRSASQPDGAPDDGLGRTEIWGYGIQLPGGGTQTGSLKMDQVRLDLPSLLTVTNANDSGAGSLRWAIGRLANGGTVTFDPALAGQTISLTSGVLTLGKDVTIDASAASGLTLDGNASDRIFIINAGTTATLKYLTIANGYGWDLAGGILNNGTLNLDHSTVRDNRVDTGANDYWKGGGGIYTGGGSVLNLTYSSVTNNTSNATDGGGILAFQNSTATIANSTISGNTAGNVGGGFRSLGNANILNSTISGNRSLGWHGGAIFHTDGALDIRYSTITENAGPDWAPSAIFIGSFNASVPSLYIANTIVTNNRWYACDHWTGPNTLTSGGHNLLQDDTCSPAASDLINPNGLLGLLADNGGPTWTHALLDGSPAIDAADDGACPAVDQRGIARPQGAHCDIGAFER